MSVNDVPLDVSSIRGVEDMVLHEVLVNANGNGPNVLIMIHDMSPEIISHAVRLYTLREEGDGFTVHSEIAAYSFNDRPTAIDFADRIPAMSAVEILIIMDDNDGDGAADDETFTTKWTH